MRVVFMGTPDPAAVSLRAVAAAQDVVSVYTQPDRPAGRGLDVRSSPVKSAARALGLGVQEPASLKDADEHGRLRELEPDAIAVVAYGQILPPEVLDIPRLGCVNLHFSLLPKWRGAAPVERALIAGERLTGVTTMLMDAGLDTGPILLQERDHVAPEDTGGAVLERLAALGAALLVRTLAGLEGGTVTPKPQPDISASYARRITSTDAELVFEMPAARLVDLVRALNPDPGAFTWYRGRRLKVWGVRAIPGSGQAGTIAAVADEGPDIQTADGRVRLLEVQPEGKKRMSGQEFVRGYRPAVREALGAHDTP